MYNFITINNDNLAIILSFCTKHRGKIVLHASDVQCQNGGRLPRHVGINIVQTAL